MASTPEQSERVASVSCVFEGSYRGTSAVMRRDGSQATARDGTPLISIRLLVGQGEHEALEQVTLRETDAPSLIPLGELVRIPGSVGVSKRGDRVFVSRWGNSVQFAGSEVAGARSNGHATKGELAAVS